MMSIKIIMNPPPPFKIGVEALSQSRAPWWTWHWNWKVMTSTQYYQVHQCMSYEFFLSVDITSILSRSKPYVQWVLTGIPSYLINFYSHTRTEQESGVSHTICFLYQEVSIITQTFWFAVAGSPLFTAFWLACNANIRQRDINLPQAFCTRCMSCASFVVVILHLA
jgi:hypothetical protein